MMKNNSTSYRPERVANVIKREISVIIDSEVNDPKVHDVTVTDVECSKDLHFATVWVAVGGDDGEVVTALNKCAGYIRRQLIEILSDMRYIPSIKFSLDVSQSYYNRIDEVIKEIHAADDK